MFYSKKANHIKKRKSNESDFGTQETKSNPSDTASKMGTTMSNAPNKQTGQTRPTPQFGAASKTPEAPKPQGQPQKIVKTPKDKCDEIQIELENLEKDINAFNGKKSDRVYLMIDEFLTRCLIKLDDIEKGDETFNQYRKSLINFANRLADKLESKCQNDAKETEESPIQTGSPQTLDATTNATNSQEESKTINQGAEQTTSELTQDSNLAHNMVKYIVLVKTGDLANAGTDSKVTLTIYGKNGNTDEIVLDGNNSNLGKDLFERNSTDEFSVEAEDLGKITHIKIGTDGSKLASSWYLESITVKSPSETQNWEVNKWLADEDLSVELKAKIEEKPKEEPKPKAEEKPKKEEKTNEKKETPRSKNETPVSTKKSESKSTKKTLPPVKPPRSNEFTHLELERIKGGLNREVSTIKFTKRKEHMPFIFNDLNPYYDVKHVENLIYSPLNQQHVGYYNRYTAINIVEPWVAYRMERTLPPYVTRSLSHSLLPRSSLNNSSFEKPERLEGSTLAPNFPKVIVKKPKDLNGPFYVDDVKAIRKEIKKNYKSTTRFEEDRKRTINDYFRMRLNETADREGMTKAYHAYLENSAGSKKALEELLITSNREEIETE
ncbi:unnamed protein product [Brachionus calyciflorus]|uniref:PLAT domain-containing protein n=1 Tax=Brachionus calyciflorus TaxID=104777 RepID=A0A813S649_9BILA|nr:unnamed protein product [Brachionus calyciflorus]